VRGDVHSPRSDSYLCCNNNVDAGAVVEFGRAVYCGNVMALGGCLLVGRWSRVGEMLVRLQPVMLAI